MKSFGLAAIIFVLAGSSFTLAQEVPKPAPAVEPSGQPRSIQPPETPAEKAMRQFRRYDAGRSGPFSGGAAVMAPTPLPRTQGAMTGHPQLPPMSDDPSLAN
jgi:hypothetical protein